MEPRTTSHAAGRTIKTISGTLVLLQELERGEGRKVLTALLPQEGAERGVGGGGGGVGTKKEPSQKVAEPPRVSASASIT